MTDTTVAAPQDRPRSLSADDMTTLGMLAHITVYGPSPLERKGADRLIGSIARRAGTTPFRAMSAALAELPFDDEEEELLAAA